MVLRGAASTLDDLARMRGGTLGRPDRHAEPQGSQDGDYHTFNVTEEFDEVDADNLETGRYVVGYEFTVDPQVAYVWGYGQPNARQVGRIYGDIQAGDESNIICKVRLSSDNARQSDPDRHGEFDSTEINQSITSREDWTRLHERDMPMVQEDSRLQVEIKALEESPSNIDSSNTDLIVSATEFEQP